ncbi:hypothetical protein NRR50_005759, partial [Klebsiella pneumoniae]
TLIIGYLMINGNGGKCKSTANKYALSATDLPGEHLALMESGNTLMALLRKVRISRSFLPKLTR